MVKNPPAKAGDTGSIPGTGRSPGEGNGNPLQCSCLENPMDGGAWWATVHGVAKSAMTQQPGKRGLGLPLAHGDLRGRGSSADRASMPGPGPPEPRRLSGHRAGRCQAGTPRPTSAAGSRPQAAPPLLGGGSTGDLAAPLAAGKRVPTHLSNCQGHMCRLATPRVQSQPPDLLLPSLQDKPDTPNFAAAFVSHSTGFPGAGVCALERGRCRVWRKQDPGLCT